MPPQPSIAGLGMVFSGWNRKQKAEMLEAHPGRGRYDWRKDFDAQKSFKM